MTKSPILRFSVCVGSVLSGKPVTAGTQRSYEEPHVDESRDSRQGDNERCLHACICVHRHAYAQHVIAARDQTSKFRTGVVGNSVPPHPDIFS